MSDQSKFEKCIVRRTRDHGLLEIDCKLGLWSVSGADAERVENEARHYWIQYFQDGEYAALLNP